MSEAYYSQPDVRNSNSTEFIMEELVDQRELIHDLLRDKFTSSEIFTEGYTTEFTPPETLAGLLGAANAPVESAIDTHVIRQGLDGGNLSHVTLKIVPSDRLPLLLENDHDLVTIQQAEMSAMIPSCVYRETLEAVFKNHADDLLVSSLSNNQLLDAVLLLSPRAQRHYEFKDENTDGNVNIQFTEIETADNTIHSLSVEMLRPHPSGLMVGTHLLVRESLLDRQSMEPDVINHEKTIRALTAVPTNETELTVEALISEVSGTRQIDLASLTPYHMADILDALDTLKTAPSN